MPVTPEALRRIAIAAIWTGLFLLYFVGLRKQRRKQGALKKYLAAYSQGAYAEALEAAERFREDGQMRNYWAFRGGALRQLGQLDEAARSLRQAIALAQQTESQVQGRGRAGATAALEKEIKLSALHQSSLGSVYLEQGRYDEATRCFEASLRDWPGHGPFHARLAEACVRRGDPPSDALRWATLAVEEDRAGKEVLPQAYNMNLCEDLGTLAWAVAIASKDRSQVDRLVEEAVTLAAPLSVPTRAQVQYESGLAYAALDDNALSRRYWEEATQIDTQGRWGRAARAKLAEPRQ